MRGARKEKMQSRGIIAPLSPAMKEIYRELPAQQSCLGLLPFPTSLYVTVLRRARLDSTRGAMRSQKTEEKKFAASKCFLGISTAVETGRAKLQLAIRLAARCVSAPAEKRATGDEADQQAKARNCDAGQQPAPESLPPRLHLFLTQSVW